MQNGEATLTELTILDASNSQLQMWHDVQTNPDTLKYNMSWLFKITGNFKLVAFHFAWQQLVYAYPSLRTRLRFDEREKKLLQIIDNKLLPVFTVTVANGVNDDAVKIILDSEIKTHFKLDQLPLCFGQLVISDVNTCYLLLTFHHFVLDGHSIPILLQKFSEFYVQYINGNSSIVVATAALMTQWLAREKQNRKELEQNNAKNFWCNYLANAPRRINFPGIHNAQENRMQRRCIPFQISKELTGALNKFNSTYKTTTFITMTSLFAMLLHHYSQQEKMVFCYPVGKRPVGFESLIGYHVNMLPMIVEVSNDKSMLHIIEEIKKHRNEIKAKQYDRFPVVEIIKQLKLLPINNAALFNVFVCPTSFGNLTIPGLSVSEVELDTAENLFDISLFFEQSDTLHCSIEYDVKKFKEEWVQELITAFKIMFQYLIDNPTHTITQLYSLSAENRCKK